MNFDDHDPRSRERDLTERRASDRSTRKTDLDAKPEQAAPPSDVLEGQLGPDELPDPVEVKMNQEARLHH